MEETLTVISRAVSAIT